MRSILIIGCLFITTAATAGWTPTPMGRWDMPADRGAAVRVVASDGLALIAADDTDANNNPGGWFWTVDVSDPDAPADGGELELTGVPTDIARHGDIVAVTWYHQRTNRGAVALIDVSDPDAPWSVAEITVFGAPEAVVWKTPYLLVGVRGTGAAIDDHLLVEYVADPATPVYIGTEPLPYATMAMTLDGDRLYLAGDAGSLAQLEWLDVADPTDIGIEDSYGLNFYFTSLDAEGDRLHTLLTDGAYVLVDLSLGFLWFRGSAYLDAPATGLARDGDVLYTAGGDLTVIDAADPDAPFIAGSYAAGTAVDVAVTDQFCVMLDAGGLWTLPLYDESTPVAVGDFTATARDGGVDLRWRADEVGETDFQLNGKLPGRIWPIAVRQDGPGLFSARDTAVPVGEVAYTLAIRSGDRWPTVGETAVRLAPPAATVLHDPYPNPFNPRVTVPFDLATPGPARLTVHDTRGRQLATLLDTTLPAGRHHIVWNGMDATGQLAPSGTYFMRLEAGESSLVTKAVMLR